MTTVQEVQDLAAELQALRPDWPDIIPIVNHLLPWRHLPYHQLRYLTTGWVKDHGNRTPASLKYMLPVPPKQAGSDVSPRTSKEPPCYICGRSRTDCAKLHDFEVMHGLPDPHDFETKEDAERNAKPWRFDPVTLALLAVPRVNDAEDSPERAAAKARARQAVADARAKSKYKPAPEPDRRPIQEPWPEETPA